MKKLFKTGVVFAALAAVGALSFGTTNLTFADVRPSQKVIITSHNLDEILFANNPDTIRAMNAIMKAKDQVNIARAALLPSISLNVVLAISNPPMFMVNSISCLVPFLFPSNWYDLAAAKAAKGAEIMGYHIVRLNVYSQAYALSEAVSGDVAVLASMETHYARLQAYLSNLETQASLGVIPEFEVNRARLELGKYAMDLSGVRQLIAAERAAIRKLFGFEITQEFDFAMSEVGPSPFETQSPAESLDDIVARAPERLQINHLIAQAHARVGAAKWAWLGGCQGAQGGFGIGNSNGNAFSLSTGFSINIGFGTYPRIQLARRDLADMYQRQVELKLEMARILEVSVSDIAEIKTRMGYAAQNVATSERMLAEQEALLPLGRVSVKDMLDTYASISQSTTSGMTNRMALDGHRITLKRVTLEGGFLKVYTNSRRFLELGR